MIIEFSIGNFRSFKDLETLSMLAAPIQSKDKNLDVDNIVFVNNKLSLLRSKAIYGANASGKSNIMKAFSIFKNLVRSSVANEEIIKKACDDFVLDGEIGTKPVFYQILFFHESVIYRYGIEVMQGEIVNEWLYRNAKGRESKLFIREGNKVSVNAAQFSEAKKFENLALNGESDIFQPHSLFLSATAAVGVKLAKALQQSINGMRIINTTDTAVLRKLSIDWWVKDENRKKGIELLKAADTGIEDIGVLEDEKLNNNTLREPQNIIYKEEKTKIPLLTSLRKIRQKENAADTIIETLFDSFESEGTQKFSYIIPFILDTLDTKSVLWIDEIEAHLHPLLTKKIISLFHSADTNPHGSQLIFTTHDTNLLKSSFLRRDQICFVEKEKSGASHIKTLVEYKGVRNDASYDKDYLQGRYGAVPFLNELNQAVQKGIKQNG